MSQTAGTFRGPIQEETVLDDRVITESADRLVPEAFDRPHTAHSVDVVDVSATGRAAFDAWIEERIVEAQTTRYAWGGRPVGYAIAEGTDGTRWRWDRDPCCPPSWLVDRVRQESRHLQEPWVFAVDLPWPEPVWEVYDRELGGYVELEEPLIDPDWDISWYAEARGRGVAAVRAGVISMYLDAEHARQATSPKTGLARIFHRLLYAHPDRKRHPLR